MEYLGWSFILQNVSFARPIEGTGEIRELAKTSLKLLPESALTA